MQIIEESAVCLHLRTTDRRILRSLMWYNRGAGHANGFMDGGHDPGQILPVLQGDEAAIGARSYVLKDLLLRKINI